MVSRLVVFLVVAGQTVAVSVGLEPKVWLGVVAEPGLVSAAAELVSRAVVGRFRRV